MQPTDAELPPAPAQSIAGVFAYRERRVGRSLLATLCLAGIVVELDYLTAALYLRRTEVIAYFEPPVLSGVAG